MIPLKPDAKPFQQKLINMCPSLEPLVKQELNKLLLSHITFLVRHCKWVANLVPVRKKNGDIILRIDLCNLNKALERDKYLVPPMEQILQRVSRSKMFSLLDGFFGYNQILVSHNDQLTLTFRTPWGTYSYRKIQFRLINVAATFQRAMDIDI